MSVKKLLSLSVKRRRLLLGAAVGGIASFIILLPPLVFPLSFLLCAASAFLICASAFAPVPIRTLLCTFLCFFGVSFLYCGIMTAAVSLLPVRNTVCKNGAVYIDISPFGLIALTLVCYGLTRLVLRITSSRRGTRSCRVRIKLGSHTVEGDACIDTGNSLHEPFSGECVIVARKSLADRLLDTPLVSAQTKNFRMIPYASVGGCGAIPSVKPDKITLILGKSEQNVSAYLAFCSDAHITKEVNMLVPSALIE